MTTQNPQSGDSRRDQVIAGEYVLGVLSADDRRKVEARMVLDGAFAAMVNHWQSNLTSFDDAYEPIAPPPQVLVAVERRLFAEQARPVVAAGGFWNSLALWRVLTLASVAGLVTVATFASGMLAPVSQTKPLVAELTGDASTTINLLAQYDAGNGALKITPVAAKQTEAKSLELWLIEGDNPAKSLGILPQTGEGEIIIPAELRSKFGAGVTLAVSVEPFGGSPTGTATGPVVAVGKTRLP
ncbi:anti-sigma factor domain-containing protein [Rhizobium sp. PL01]|jgi:anti-sigma-K factor RskA|uniref:anti-sigma factor n=1 Tax=Rhizobium sp. PL01 TaxID=3085631 RepID=UPI00298298B0|nr:anti-sigma factor [Rhizobium sp. PL01]MDW5315185.1 anti-sigma factor [Rhizobium sp. PL01]